MTIEDVKGFIGKHVLEITSVLNKVKVKYRIERFGKTYPNEFMPLRFRVQLDQNDNIKSILTG